MVIKVDKNKRLQIGTGILKCAQNEKLLFLRQPAAPGYLPSKYQPSTAVLFFQNKTRLQGDLAKDLQLQQLSISRWSRWIKPISLVGTGFTRN